MSRSPLRPAAPRCAPAAPAMAAAPLRGQTLGSPATRPRARATVPGCQALDMNFLSSGVSQKPICQERKPRHREAESG